MFGINDSISFAMNLLAPPSPPAGRDVPPNFDWRGSEVHHMRSQGLTGQASINDPLYDWSNAASRSTGPGNRVSTPASTYSYSSGQVSTPSGYTCVPDPGFGVQFRPITPFAPTPHTPASRIPASFESPQPPSPIPTPVSYGTARSTRSSPNPMSSSSSSTQYTTASSTPSSTSASSAQFSPITHVDPPAYDHSRSYSSVLGRPTNLLPSYRGTNTSGQLDRSEPATYDSPARSYASIDSSLRKETPSWDKARPLFRPETPPGIVETTLQELDYRPGSQATQKRKSPPVPNDSPLKQRRRIQQEVVIVESDSEDGEYEGIQPFDTGYQSVDDKAKIKQKPPPKAMASRQTKGRGKKSPAKSRAIIGDDKHEAEDMVKEDVDDDDRDSVKIKEEPAEKKRIKPATKFVPLGTKWGGPRGGGIKFNAKAPRPEGWVDGAYRWSYSTGAPVSAALYDRLPGDIHFCHSTEPYADEGGPFTTWVARGDSKGLRWVEYTAGQPHPQFNGWVLQEAALPKTPPRWVKEATFKAKY
ncbi:hypothetical protein FRC06_006905 [Ceratobasidium sp. 370]|nr:hypothetical protein FRC06_006905 [Ceratobasidium sp. 370]